MRRTVALHDASRGHLRVCFTLTHNPEASSILATSGGPLKYLRWTVVVVGVLFVSLSSIVPRFDAPETSYNETDTPVNVTTPLAARADLGVPAGHIVAIRKEQSARLVPDATVYGVRQRPGDANVAFSPESFYARSSASGSSLVRSIFSTRIEYSAQGTRTAFEVDITHPESNPNKGETSMLLINRTMKCSKVTLRFCWQLLSSCRRL